MALSYAAQHPLDLSDQLMTAPPHHAKLLALRWIQQVDSTGPSFRFQYVLVSTCVFVRLREKGSLEKDRWVGLVAGISKFSRSSCLPPNCSGTDSTSGWASWFEQVLSVGDELPLWGALQAQSGSTEKNCWKKERGWLYLQHCVGMGTHHVYLKSELSRIKPTMFAACVAIICDAVSSWVFCQCQTLVSRDQIKKVGAIEGM